MLKRMVLVACSRNLVSERSMDFSDVLKGLVWGEVSYILPTHTECSLEEIVFKSYIASSYSLAVLICGVTL